jgi:RHS repeat-associated protein
MKWFPLALLLFLAACTTATFQPTPGQPASATAGIPANLLFADDFKGSPTPTWAWSSRVVNANLSMSSAAALHGNHGMQVTVASTTSLYVTDDTPNAESEYHARFYFDPNSLTMATGDAHYIFQAYNASNVPIVRLLLRRDVSGVYQLLGDTHQDTNGSFPHTGFITLTAAPHAIEFSWRAASAANANDGQFTLHLDGFAVGTIRTDLDNDTRRIDYVRLGAVGGLDSGTSGSYYFDDFISRRSSYIGNAAVAIKSHARPNYRPRTDYTAATTITYTYDHLGRLTDAAYSDGTSYHYEYDAVGNRLSATAPSGLTLYAYDSANRLILVNGAPYTWDTNGNLLSDGVYTYAYDHANRLKGVSGQAAVVSYRYNGHGDRLQQTTNSVTTNYTLDLNTGLTQVLADSANTYLHGRGRIAQSALSTPQSKIYFLGDALGSVRQLTDSTGTITLSRSYTPYGETQSEISNPQSEITNFGFTGEATEPTGQIFLRARYYAPGMGRFLSRDVWSGDSQVPMSYNAWLYTYANPVMLVDLSGLLPTDMCDRLPLDEQELCRNGVKPPLTQNYNEKLPPTNITFIGRNLSPIKITTYKDGFARDHSTGNAAQIIDLVKWGHSTGLCGQASLAAIVGESLNQVVKDWEKTKYAGTIGGLGDPNYSSLAACRRTRQGVIIG